MKFLSPLAVASTTVASAIPGQVSFSSLLHLSPKELASTYPAAEFFQNMEWVALRHTEGAGFRTAEPLGNDYGPAEHLTYPHSYSMKRAEFTSIGELDSHSPDDDKSSLTLYERIANDEDYTIFAKFLSEFDDIMEKLNSLSSTHTVFVPTDEAFKKFSHRPDPPREYLRSFIEYHISPELFPARKVFSSRTIPTLLDESELGPYPQRVSIQLGIRGLTLNYMSRLTKTNIDAKNGVIHALDHVLIPPFSAADTLNFFSSRFSTFELGLVKTGLFDEINTTSTHTGATFFLPTNHAFTKLPDTVTAFLFSRWGEKYLKALLKYHIVFDHTLYSDAYNKPKDEQLANPATHIDLPTLLNNRHLSIDIAHFNRFFSIKVNGFTTVAATDVVVKDGVIQVLNDVLLPPKEPDRESRKQQVNGLQDVMFMQQPSHEANDIGSLTVDELIRRLEPFSD